MLVWHFFSDDGTTGEGRLPVRVGETMRVEGEIIPCERGLHGSIRALDALRYAPGSMVQRARLGGVIVPHADDKHAASQRTCLASADASDALRSFARWCALQVIDLWDAPQITREYLHSGDESIRAAARDAARDAAWDAAMGAARDAAWDAAMGAAWDAARAAQNAELESRLRGLLGVIE